MISVVLPVLEESTVVAKHQNNCISEKHNIVICTLNSFVTLLHQTPFDIPYFHYSISLVSIQYSKVPVCHINTK